MIHAQALFPPTTRTIATNSTTAVLVKQHRLIRFNINSVLLQG